MAKNDIVGFIGGKFLPLHLGHVHAISSAARKVDELYVVLTSSKKRDRELCKRDRIKYIPADIRLSWIGAAIKDIKNAKVIHVEDEWGDKDYDWNKGARMIKRAIGKQIDFVFSSETKYEKHFSKNYPEAKHKVLDSERKRFRISATQIRKDPYRNWSMLPEYVRPFFTKKIAIVGTESCGKTTLAKKLAKFYNTNFVPEIGRDYCNRYSNQLTPQMFGHIAMEHYLLQIRASEKSNKLLFIDSEAVITQYYLDMYFNGNKSPLIEEIIKLQDYDLVLFLEPDVKWVDDGLRFAGDDETRIKNNGKLKKMFDERNIHYKTIDGDYSERFLKARKHIDGLFRGEEK